MPSGYFCGAKVLANVGSACIYSGRDTRRSEIEIGININKIQIGCRNNEANVEKAK